MCARADGGLKDGEGSGGELVLLNLSYFVLAVICKYIVDSVDIGVDTYVNSDRGFARSSL